jgi:hypothetical protein
MAGTTPGATTFNDAIPSIYLNLQIKYHNKEGPRGQKLEKRPQEPEKEINIKKGEM